MKLNSGTLFSIYILIILLVGALLPTRTVWSPRYGSEHKDPLGTNVLFNQLPTLFSSGDIVRSTTPIFNTLKSDVYETNYIFINDKYLADPLDISYLLKYIAEGNNGFISAEDFSSEFKDTIGFEVYSDYYWARAFDRDTTRASMYLFNEALRADSTAVHEVLKGSKVSYVDSLASLSIVALGNNADGDINYFRKKIGDGHLHIHLCPAAFSNYELLYEHTGNYVASCLSYLPNGGVIFDDYYKSGKVEHGSLLSVILSHPPMKWAWNLTLLAIGLFLIFGARRKARAIPVLSPYENESLQYIETIGAMHYNQRNNRHIADKRLKQLKNYLHQRFKLQEQDWHSLNAVLFYERTGVPVDRWQSLFESAVKIDGRREWEVNQLRAFSDEIDTIYSEIKST